ncbi:lytic transglycosylase domain-containing protein [Planosporangium flavigriseum]|uniref:Transglycosylase SLT domain-containing protein n=1 Tax=Planosporangium flavigriseum TaxID=373681 RepID=A0A8J3PMW6_9ACTN|nr:transglycosylase SLT domain-containing protein [Planosporangium flavigriseum]NJC65300.1 lytic transglycosylase domain-containing protein [Planosporangium flavigriseum]GIG73346.1 hypothetical protein Pfl04_17500 [Planosporangium flavigriseum]
MGSGRRVKIMGAAAVLAGLLVVAGCARDTRGGAVDLHGRSAGEPYGEASATPTPAASPTAAPAAPIAPTASARPSVTPKPTRTAKPAAVTPSRDPVKAAQPLPPPPHQPGPRPTSPPPGAKCPSYTGTNAPKSDVRAALDTVAGTSFWYNSAPQIRIPENLMYAVAWQESGWQSAILACDGGIGTMQIMPDTATWLNDRFAPKNYDVHTVTGNIMLGGEYLSWLVKYFGDAYYESNYDLSVPAPAGSVSLLDSVVSAYNYGPGAVHPDQGEAGIPNWQYVNNVEALMTNCPCLAAS